MDSWKYVQREQSTDSVLLMVVEGFMFMIEC